MKAFFLAVWIARLHEKRVADWVIGRAGAPFVNSSDLPRTRECYWKKGVELSLIPIQLGQRQNLRRKLGLTSVRLKILDMQRSRNVWAGILPEKRNAAARVEQRIFIVKKDVRSSQRWVAAVSEEPDL